MLVVMAQHLIWHHTYTVYKLTTAFNVSFMLGLGPGQNYILHASHVGIGNGQRSKRRNLRSVAMLSLLEARGKARPVRTEPGSCPLRCFLAERARPVAGI